jgi:hypothetical protein
MDSSLHSAGFSMQLANAVAAGVAGRIGQVLIDDLRLAGRSWFDEVSITPLRANGAASVLGS